MADDRVGDKVNRKPVIGLLGGPGSGKSRVARIMSELGCGVIDSDEIAKQVIEEEEVKRKLVRRWGEGILDNRGVIDHRLLGNVVFSDEKELNKLESIVHPQVHLRRSELMEQYQSSGELRGVVEDCPLLLEKSIDTSCDVLVFVKADRDIRLERVKRSKGWDDRELSRREKNQMPLDTKLKAADYVIQNETDNDELLANEVRRVLSQILQNQTQGN